jgi:alkylation response protein AidB-like acyl-CoA dehydrogenase
MALILNEEQGMLRDSAAQFLAENATVSHLRKLRDTKDPDGFSRPVWKQFNELGFTGMLIPEAQGGLGLGFVEVGALMEQVGHHLSASPFLASSVVAVTALRHLGMTEQQDEWLPRLASGQAIASLAIDEVSKHQPSRIEATAHRTSSGWRLEGQKTFVLEGHVADFLIVVARTSSHALGLFILPTKTMDDTTAGLSIERVSMVDSRPVARVIMKSVELGQDAQLGGATAGDASLALEHVLDAGRAACAAELLGIADEVFHRTTRYLKERKQFGRLIGEFQGLQHRAATLFCDIELARAAVMKAMQTLDSDPSKASQSVAIAKARAGSSAMLAVQEGVQMHGGMGMTDEFEIGFYMKRARVLQELWGDANYHQDRLASARSY